MSQTLIEGVGDEVTVFVGLLVLLVVLTLAWVSTGVADRPFVSVIVLDGRTFQQFIARLRGRRATTPVEGSSGSNTPSTSSTNGTSAESAAVPAEGGTGAAESEGQGGEEVVAPTLPPVGLGKAENVGAVGGVAEQVAATSPPEAATPASTPGSESFVHLSGSSNDNLSESSPDGDGDTPVAPSECSSETTGQSSCTPEGSELRQRRLAFFTNPRSNDSTTSGLTPQTGLTSDTTETTPTVESRPEPQTEDSPVDSQQGSGNEPSAPTEPVSEGFEPLDGHIRIRIKYLDDRQRWVQARPEETVAQFKRAHFGAELGENTMIRFIYNGRELTRDGQSLASYNISDESVIHCLVSHVSRQNTEDVVHGMVQFDMGTLMLPLFGLILALIWYSRFTYKQYFNTMSTLTLIGISFLFVVALFASLRVQDHPDPVEAAVEAD